MRCSLTWSQSSPLWRRVLVFNAVAWVVLWTGALFSPVASLPGWVFSALSLCAALSVLQGLFLPEFHARRLHLALAGLLLWSVQEVQWGGWLTTPADALAAGSNPKPGAESLGSLLQWQGLMLLRGHWVSTLLDQPAWRYWVAIPLCAGSLMFWRRFPVPNLIVRLAALCALLWLGLGVWLMARGLVDWTASAPWWFWVVLMIGPWSLRGLDSWLVIAIVAVSAAVLLVKMLAALLPGGSIWVIQALLGFTVVGTVVCWLAWWFFLDRLKLHGEVYDRRRLETHQLEVGTLDDLFLPSDLSPAAAPTADRREAPNVSAQEAKRF